MFTGIVQAVGKIGEWRTEKGRQYLVLQPLKNTSKTKLGGSVAFNGVCLTLARRTKTALWFEVMPETLRKTNLGSLKKNSLVNIEPALRAGDELGGHLVQGHIDAAGEVKKIVADGKNMLVDLEIPKELKSFIVLHGSITLDGISLTVARLNAKTLTVSLIVETLARTIWKNLKVGQKINIEVDVIGKYLKNFVK